MPQTTIEEVFQGPWGIVQSRREEIESGSFGSFDRIHQEEVSRNFLSLPRAMQLLNRSESTARKRLQDARYIMRGGAHWYYLPDVQAVKSAIEEAERQRAAKKSTK